MKKCLFLVLLLLGLSPIHAADAATIVKSIGLNYGASLPEDFLFDPALGTLTSVELFIEGDTDLEYESWDQEPWGEADEWVYTEVDIYIDVDGSSPRNIYYSWVDGDGFVESDSGDPYAYGYAFFSGEEYLTDPSVLSDFTLQPGDTEVYAGAELGFVDPDVIVDDLGKIYEFCCGESWGDIEVTYTYAPVPIPGAVWLLGSGLIGLAAVRRRKKS